MADVYYDYLTEVYYGYISEEFFQKKANDNHQGFDDVQTAVECALVALMEMV